MEQEFAFKVEIPTRPNSPDVEKWLQKHPERIWVWRTKIRWTVRGVIAMRRHRIVASKVAHFRVPMAPLTLDEKTYVSAQLAS